MNRVLAITLALGLGFIALPVVAEEVASKPTVTAQLIPGRVLTGSEVQVFVVVRNPTDARVHFDLVIWHGGHGWGQRDRPVRATDNTFVYWSGLQQDGGFAHFWSADLEPGLQATFYLPSTSGLRLGTHRFLRVSGHLTSASAVRQIQRDLEVLGK